MKFLKWLLIFVPIAIIASFLKVSDPVLFVLSALAIIPLAGVMGKGTDVISYYAGNKIGGFLNATFGNATELIISIVAMKAGMFDVVKSSVAGAVIGNVLLVLGFAMLCGGLKFKTQSFNKHSINVTASMLLFAVIGLSVPAVFTHLMSDNTMAKYEGLSVVVGVIMLAIYVFQIIFSFFTHKDFYVNEEDEVEEKPDMSLKMAIGMLVLATVFVAILSEIFVGTVEPMAESAGLTSTFVGIIIVPVIGNAAEHSTAVMMALKNKMNVAVEIALGSSLQIVLFVTPVLILLSLFFTPMDIIFTPFELVALAATVLIANRVAADGESNWLEGAQLIAVYVIIAACFFIV